MPYFLQEEPQDGTTIMNNAVRNGAIQEQQNLIDRARQAAIEQDPTLSFVNRQIASGLLGAKTAWQDAFNKGDAQGMVNAQKAADSLRQQAASIGWDANGYGADVSLEQAAQNLANNDTRAINNIFYNLQDSGDLYTQGVADYLDKGYSIDSAKRLAGQNADRNTRGNINQLIDAYHMYGTDPRGAINQNGLRLLGMMAQQGGVSPSELVNFYAKMQASPKDNWNFENSLLTAQNAQNYALDRMDRSQQYTRENQANAFAQQEKMARLNNDLGIQRMMAQAQIQIQSGVMSKEAGYNWMVQKMVEAGVDEQTARQYAATQLIAGKGGKGGAGGFNKDLAKELRETANSLYEQADAAELNGDKERAAQLRAQADQYMAQHTAMLSGGKADSNDAGVDVNDYNSLRKAFQQLINDNANRPWDKQRDRADLVRIFLSNVGEDNPMAQKIVNEAEWGGNTESEPAKPSESKQEPQASSSKPQQTKTSSSSGTYTGQQIVVPEGTAQAVRDAVTMIPVYGPDGKFKRSIYPYQITSEMAINEGPNGRYVVE